MTEEVANDNKIKHLEFIQLVITRMNVNSFLLKGWAVTLVSALFAFAAKDSNPKFFWITFVSVPIFWGLDAFYLLQERLYRCLYDNVRQKPAVEIDYNMDATQFKSVRNNWWNCLGSKTLSWFYLFMLAIIIVVTFKIR